MGTRVAVVSHQHVIKHLENSATQLRRIRLLALSTVFEELLGSWTSVGFWMETGAAFRINISALLKDQHRGKEKFGTIRVPREKAAHRDVQR